MSGKRKNAEPFTVAVVQSAPCMFDADATLARMRSYLEKAAEAGARLVLFPEAFYPAYPRGQAFGAVVGHRSPQGRTLWEAFYQASVTVPGSFTRRLGKLARSVGTYLAVGVSERKSPGHTLYCSLLYFDPKGKLLGLHRKIKPTGTERLIWGDGPGDDLQVYPTPLGHMGGLICWENYMPLARMTLYRQQVTLYLAPTADARPSWQATIRHIACEGRCVVLAANQLVRPEDYPEPWSPADEATATCRGGSAIVGPYGDYLAGPIYDAPGLLLAEIDPAEIVRSRMDFDVDGHYQRPDLFAFAWRPPTQPRAPD